MHKVFISYHHENDQWYKNKLVKHAEMYSIFIDMSVDTGDISDHLSDESIRQKIRDEYLKNSTVTIVLVGEETRKRKHVDWEIYSSMYDGKINSKSGIIVINLPETSSYWLFSPDYNKTRDIFRHEEVTYVFNYRQACEDRYPFMPDRIVDNLIKPHADIYVVPWYTIINYPDILKYLIELAYQGRGWCKYKLGEPLRRHNS